MFLKNLTFLIIFLLSTSSDGLLNASQYELTSKNKKALKHYTSAETAFRSGDYELAKTYLTKAVKADDAFIEAWLLLGDVNIELHAKDEAILSYKIAIRVDSGFFPRAYYFVGNLYFETGDYADAVIYYTLFSDFINDDSALNQLAETSLKKAKFSNEAINNPVSEPPQNLGPVINSSDDEYMNFVDATSTQVVLTRKSAAGLDNYGRAYYLENLYEANLLNGEWTKPDTINTEWNEDVNIGGMNMSIDGRKMYFTGCNWPSGFGSCDLMVSFRKGKYWQSPFNLGPDVNSQWWDSQPMISSDGKQLYFASRRANGKGGSDLWMSVRLKDGNWSPPINLGDSINSEGNEMAPFIHSDGKTLYFSSTGHYGLGKADLFFSRKDEAGIWSKAKNLGYPINSGENEINLVITLDGQQAWISSDREGGLGKTDIYLIDVYKKMAPGKVYYVKGTIHDKESNKPLIAKVVLTDVTTGLVKNATISDPVTGEFLMVLQPDMNYAFNISSDGYLFYSENFDTHAQKSTEPIHKLFNLSPLTTGERIVLRNVFFDFDSIELKPESYSELNKLYSLLVAHPDMKIKIEGHTDNIGDDSYNLTLSTNRAKAVYTYFIKKGIPATNITYEGFGSASPMFNNDTEKGRAGNRRTEVEIL